MALKGIRLLVYAVALIVLAWALSSLSRARAGGLLANSYWLVYLLYLLPAVSFAGFLLAVVMFVWGSKSLLRVRRHRKWVATAREPKSTRATRSGEKEGRPRWNASAIVILGVSGFALFSFVVACSPSLEKRSPGAPALVDCNPFTSRVLGTWSERVLISGGDPPSAIEGSLLYVGNIVTSPWFQIAFLATLIGSSALFARSILWEGRVRKEEGSDLAFIIQTEGVEAVRDAIRILEDRAEVDPRARIIGCYQRMARAASGLGVEISPEQTVRELEVAIRKAFQLRGNALKELTRLFEEARYSLHMISEEDSFKAQKHLVSIQKELQAKG